MCSCKFFMSLILISLGWSLIVIYLSNNSKLNCALNIDYKNKIDLSRTLNPWCFQYSTSNIILKSKCPSKNKNFNIIHQDKLSAYVINASPKISSRSYIRDCQKRNLFKEMMN